MHIKHKHHYTPKRYVLLVFCHHWGLDLLLVKPQPKLDTVHDLRPAIPFKMGSLAVRKFSDIYFSNTIYRGYTRENVYHCNPLNEIFLMNTFSK